MSRKQFLQKWSARALDRVLRRSEGAPSAPASIELLDAADPKTRRRVRELLARPGYRLRDTLHEQLIELAGLANPSKRLAGRDLDRAIAEQRAGVPIERFGSYVHYPWNREVVRVLPRQAFVRVRTSRNQYKITADEQRLLSSKRVAVAGLSVGLAVVQTLALERVGGKFHLADFDELSLSNMNRLNASVSEIGLAKTTLAARRLLELDPYLEITLFAEGVTPANVGAFLQGADLLLEECDDLAAKLYLREQAKVRRIPVIMQTSEGGLLDVERFDLDPERPPFHGLVGDLKASELPAMSRRDKVPFVARIVEDGLSDRGAASMLEIETTVSTWPQLGSSVVAGAGAAVDVARRVLLGTFEVSGRFVFDSATSVVPGTELYTKPRQPPAPRIEPARPPSIPSPAVAAPSVIVQQIRQIVTLAGRAPSGGNVQPWSFTWSAPKLWLQLDPSRGGGALNLDELANALALGAAAESVVIGAAAAGFAVEPRAEGPLPDLVGDTARFSKVSFEFGSTCTPASAAAQRLGLRTTNRGHVASAPLSAAERTAIQGELANAHVDWFATRGELDALAEVLAEGDRFRILHPTLHADMMGELRFPDAEAATLDDGIETSTMDMDLADLAVLRLWSRPGVVAALRDFDLGRGVYELARKRARNASAALVLRTEARTFDAFFQAGRELLQLWLRAEEAGLAIQPWGALGFLVQHEENDPARAHRLQLALGQLASRYRELIPRRAGGEALLLFIHRAPRPAVLSRRRPLTDVLSEPT